MAFGPPRTYTPPKPTPYTPSPQAYNPGYTAPMPPPNYAANNATIDSQVARYNSDLGLVGQQYGMQKGYLEQDLANQLAGIGLDRSNIGIQQGALERQGPLINHLQEASQRGNNLTWQDLKDRIEHARYTAWRQRMNFSGDQAAKGAFSSQGTRGLFDDNAANLNLLEAETARNSTRLALDDHTKALGFNEQRAKLADDKAILGNMSKRLGLSENELKIRTQQALAQLGLSTTISTTDILRAMEDLQNGRYNVLAPVATQVAQGLGGGGYQP